MSYSCEVLCLAKCSENLDTEVIINRACETLRDDIRISAKESLGYYELRKQKLCSTKVAQNY